MESQEERSPVGGLYDRRLRQDFSRSTTPVNFSQIRRPSRQASLRSKTSYTSSIDNSTTRSSSTATTTTQQHISTPPQTPPHLRQQRYQHHYFSREASPQHEHQQRHQQQHQQNPLVFHNYLRALYTFDPTAHALHSVSEAGTTARIEAGDLILVHSVHANGWADGTVLRTRERGWLPTNYCEAYSHPFIENLLGATTVFNELLSRLQGVVARASLNRQGGEGDRKKRRRRADLLAGFVRRQDYIRGVIAGVRRLLEFAGCLHRDAELVLRHSGIRRMRKGLLADLSSLVDIAKKLQREALSLKGSEDDEGQDDLEDDDEQQDEDDEDDEEQDLSGYVSDQATQSVHDLLAELMGKAFKVATRAAGFLDMWTGETEEARRRISLLEGTSDGWGTVDHSRDQSVAESPQGDDGLQSQESGEAANVQHRGLALAAPVEFSAESSRAAELQRSFKEVQEATQRRRTSVIHNGRRLSTKYRPQSSLLAHRVSIISADPEGASSLASKQLTAADSECVSHIGLYVGAFVGCHLPSRDSDDLTAMRSRLAEACERIISIVDRVVSAASSNSKSEDIVQAKAEFQRQLQSLFQAAQAVLQVSDEATDGIVVILPDQTAHIITMGTNLIRKGRDCVAKTHTLIQEIGDFDLNEQPATIASVAITEEPEEVAATASNDEEGPTPPAKEQTVRPQLSLHTRSVSQKLLPPVPAPGPSPTRARAVTSIGVTDFATMPSPAITIPTPVTPVSSVEVRKSLPPLPGAEKNLSVPSAESLAIEEDGAKTSEASFSNESVGPARKTSFGTSMSGSTDTRQNSARDSGITTVSEVSTRATTPEHSRPTSKQDDKALMTNADNVSSLRTVENATDAKGDTAAAPPVSTEKQMPPKTYAHELVYNKEGQLTAGSLPALVELLTAHDAAPAAQFLSAFFITFRNFTEPCKLVQTLVDRFEYVSLSKTLATPVHLRIVNVFKGWLETYWHAEKDRAALDDIRAFAVDKLKPVLPTAGERLLELTRRVSAAYQSGTATAPLVSGVGKTSTSFFDPSHAASTPAPEPIVTKSQLAALRNALNSNAAKRSRSSTLTVLDLDPLELARQLTLLASAAIGEVKISELLSLSWSKEEGETAAPHVKQVSWSHTRLAHFVSHCILFEPDHKLRARMIKHWSKVATHCLELHNYHGVTAIMGSLNSSDVRRLKQAWALLSKKAKARVETLEPLMDPSRNQGHLRSKINKLIDSNGPPEPCVPYLGAFQADLIFAHDRSKHEVKLPAATNTSSSSPTDAAAGTPSNTSNPSFGDASLPPKKSLINFSEHAKMARTVLHLQKFQSIPYNLTPIPEIQSYLRSHLSHIHDNEDEDHEGNSHEGVATASSSAVLAAQHMEKKLHRRSLLVEPREASQHWAHAPPPPMPHKLLKVSSASSVLPSSNQGQGFQGQRQQSQVSLPERPLSAVEKRGNDVVGDEAAAPASATTTIATEMGPPPAPVPSLLRPKTAASVRAEAPSPSPAAAAKFEAFAKSALGFRRSDEVKEN